MLCPDIRYVPRMFHLFAIFNGNSAAWSLFVIVDSGKTTVQEEELAGRNAETGIIPHPLGSYGAQERSGVRENSRGLMR